MEGYLIQSCTSQLTGNYPSPGFTFHPRLLASIKEAWVHRLKLIRYPSPRLTKVMATLKSCREQARRSGYNESRKTHIQTSFKSFSNWLHASNIQCGRGMLRQTLAHWMVDSTLDGGYVKPVAETFERALDKRFPTFVVS